MSTSKPKNMPAMPPKNIGAGKTLRMDAPDAIKPSSILSLDEPSETINVADMDLDLDLEFASPGIGFTKKTASPKIKGAPPLIKPHGTMAGIPPVKNPAPKPPAAPAKAPLKVKSGLLGHILVDNNIITAEQRDFVLKLQAQSGNFFKIGQLAIKQGFLSEEDLERALQAQKKFVNRVHQEQSRMIKLPEEVANVEVQSETSNLSQESDVIKWLGSALKHGASDLHVMSNKPLILRHLGKLVQSKQKPLSEGAVASAFNAILTKDERKTLETEQSVVKCLDIKGRGRARGNIFKHMNGINGTFRLIPQKPPSLVSLNMPSILAKFTTYAQGLVLVTGPIGCGKTTTMAALVDIVNRERPAHIITVERPVEFIHKNERSLVTQREVGTNTNSFASALRAALREDPDVIAVGEMNDLETARLTISAAETGHLVFATLHTDNAVRTINRALDIFPPDEQNQIRAMLSESLRGVICQRLVQRSDEPGLVPVVEMLFTTPAMRNLIREQKVYQLPNAISMSKNMGNMTFVDHAQQLLANKMISQAVYDQFTSEEA